MTLFNVFKLVVALRQIFNWLYKVEGDTTTTAATFTSNNKQSQLELFGYLLQGLKRSRRFYQMWQRSIGGLPACEFRCVY